MSERVRLEAEQVHEAALRARKALKAGIYPTLSDVYTLLLWTLEQEGKEGAPNSDDD